MAFGLIYCGDNLTAPEDEPLLDDPPAEGVWRVSGEVYAPPDWDPVETPGIPTPTQNNTFQGLTKSKKLDYIIVSEKEGEHA